MGRWLSARALPVVPQHCWLGSVAGQLSVIGLDTVFEWSCNAWSSAYIPYVAELGLAGRAIEIEGGTVALAILVSNCYGEGLCWLCCQICWWPWDDSHGASHVQCSMTPSDAMMHVLVPLLVVDVHGLQLLTMLYISALSGVVMRFSAARCVRAS